MALQWDSLNQSGESNPCFHKGRIWVIEKAELTDLCEKAQTFSELGRMLGYGHHGTLKRRIKERLDHDNISYSHFLTRKEIGFRKKIENEDIFIENSKITSNVVRKRIDKENLIEKKCLWCGLTNYWNGKKINLQLDHVNGINNDNRIENLRWLCPNCHSQTPTFCRGGIKEGRSCSDCGSSITNQGKTGKCTRCLTSDRVSIEKETKVCTECGKYQPDPNDSGICDSCKPGQGKIRRIKSKDPGPLILNDMVKSMSIRQISEHFSVSRNAVSYWIKRHGIKKNEQ